MHTRCVLCQLPCWLLSAASNPVLCVAGRLANAGSHVHIQDDCMMECPQSHMAVADSTAFSNPGNQQEHQQLRHQQEDAASGPVEEPSAQSNATDGNAVDGLARASAALQCWHQIVRCSAVKLNGLVPLIQAGLLCKVRSGHRHLHHASRCTSTHACHNKHHCVCFGS